MQLKCNSAFVLQPSPQNGEATAALITGRPKAPIVYMEYIGRLLATSNAGKDCIFLGAVSGCRIELIRIGAGDLFRSLPISTGVHT
jgi:hypothetical protein